MRSINNSFWEGAANGYAEACVQDHVRAIVNIIYNFQLRGTEVSALVLGLCGPGNVPVHIAGNNGWLTITGAGLRGLVPCSVTANLTTKPQLSIERIRK